METKTKGNTCKLITGLFNQTVNQFQDESHEQDNQKMQQSSTPEPNPSTVEAPAKAVKLKKLLTETTSLANAPIPASLRPFFDAIEM